MSVQRRYLDLRLDLRDRTAKGFDIAATSAVGETGDVSVRLDAKAFDRAIMRLDDPLIPDADLFELGTTIGGMLLPDGPIRDVFEKALEPSDEHDAVRLRIVVHDPFLARIPWELAYLQRHGGEPGMGNFLVLDPDISMVRHTPMGETHRGLGGFDPQRLRMVVATANPARLPKLDLAAERSVIETALAKVTVPNVTIDVVSWVEDATLEGLVDGLANGADLFHFAGHGVFRETEVDPNSKLPMGIGSIALQADGGKMELLPAANLAARLDQARVRVAVLGACEGGRVDGVQDWTGIAPALIERGVAAVVAMQFPVKDTLAIGFSRAFYTALAKGVSIDEAVSLGRLDMYDLASTGWQFAVPVLYMRSDDGAIFTAETAQAPEAVTTTVIQGKRPHGSLDSIFGREAEQRRLGELLADPATRVVTVVGREGIGKSAIVSVVMAGLEDGRWPHTDERIPVAGIVYHSARDKTFTTDKLFDDCARIVGGPAGEALDGVWANDTLPLEDKIDQFLHALAGRRNIIVLDDFEAMLDDAGEIVDPRTRTLFERAVLSPWHTRLLLISRVPLTFPSSARRFDIRLELTEGLPVPDGIEMLRSLDPNDVYQVRDAPDDKLTTAVERVHGIPRALELIFTALDRDRGRSLDDALGRFYTDETVVSELLARGYEGLDADPHGADLRRVLQAIAVFDTPIGLDAIAYLLEPFGPPIDVPAAANRLGQIHLVEIDRLTGTYAVSAIDQDYVYSQIPATGAFSVQALERRAADYFASIRRPPSEWRASDGLDPQMREFDHRMRAGDPDGASAVLAGFEVDDLVWRGKGELARWYRDQLEGKLTDERQLALHAYAVGHIRLVLGPLESALQQFDDARARAKKLGDEGLEADALNASGEALRRLGRLSDAADRLRDAIPMFERSHETDDESSARLSLSLTAAYLGDGRGALEEGERAMALAETSGDARMRARADDSLSLAYLVIGDLEAALAHADASARAYTEAGQPEPLGYVVNVRGMVLLAEGRAADAAVEFERVDKAGAEVQQPRISGLGLFNLARARRVLGETPGAWDAAHSAEAALRGVGSSEASAAGALARSLKASIDGDAATEIRELLACAVESAISADLHPPLDLAQEVERRAAEAGTGAAAKGLRRDARALVKTLKARLVRPA